MALARCLADRPLPGDTSRRRRVTVNLAESPLGWLKARGMVTQRQFDAGEQLRADYERARLGPSVTMRWDASGVKTAPRAATLADPTVAQLSAKSRFDGALSAAGPGLSDILWRTICAGETLPTAERALGWPIRSARLVLTFGLDRVADFYRLAQASVPRQPR
jgi:Domain of unknown function (DUF6456)